MVTGICFTKEQVIGADVEGRADTDNIFRAQCFFAKFRGRNCLWGNACFFRQFLLCHTELFPAAQYAAADLI